MPAEIQISNDSTCLGVSNTRVFQYNLADSPPRFGIMRAQYMQGPSYCAGAQYIQGPHAAQIIGLSTCKVQLAPRGTPSCVKIFLTWRLPQTRLMPPLTRDLCQLTQTLPDPLKKMIHKGFINWPHAGTLKEHCNRPMEITLATN